MAVLEDPAEVSLRPLQPLGKSERRYQREREQEGELQGFRAGLEAKVIWGFSRNSK